MPHRTPSYRHHRPSGQAVVTLGGRDFYLGKHGTPESRAEYDRVVAEWLAAGRVPPRAGRPDAASDLTVAELVLAYVRFADGYYVKGGRPTNEPANIRAALRPLRQLYGRTPAREFGPLALKAVREAMVRAGLTRGGINKKVGKVVRAFKWAVENEMVPPAVYHGLRAVAGLRKGRSDAPESPPVRPVPEGRVEAIRGHAPRQIWAMVELQRLTGMRSGEVVIMRTADLDMAGEVWAYTPSRHKAEHHGRERRVYLGPRAQEVVRPWLRADREAYLFQPREVVAEINAGRREARKTPLTPSQRARRPKASPKKAPGVRYTPDSYRRAIRSACEKAGVEPWHPHQLRHNAATRLRREFGLDVARVVLGHSSAAVTETYAEIDREKAAAVMGKVG